MRKILLLMTLLIYVSIGSYAQTETIEKINKIKKNNSYLYGESTMPTQKEAYSVAMEILQQDITRWAVSHSKKKVEKVVATDVSNIVDSIVTKRVNMYRVFLYVKKSKLIPIFHDEGLVIVDPDAKEEKKSNIEKKDTAVISTPKTDEQKPAKKGKGKKEKKEPDYLKGVAVDEAAVVAQNKETTGVMQDELPEGKDSIATDTLSVSDTLDVDVSEKKDSATIEINEGNNATLEKIKSLKSFTELRGTLVPLKQQGEITAYGKYSTMTEPEESYLIIYDPNGRIRAILSKGDKTRKNLNTGKDDSIKNYRGCGAIWFKLK